ncbi:MAG: SDR family NAD(P)-dependent oxidoreductase [Clostridia bacterium]|nr:SDR family NAD(P)-dependent oxidoreductase [Clostridia bacterium]
MKKNQLQGKTIVISGVTSGMGRTLTVTFTKKYGARVIGIARNEEKCKALQAELPEGSFSYYLFDVSDKQAWHNFAEELKAQDVTVDILLNNAGMLPRFTRFDRFSVEETERVMAVNYFSIVYACHELLPLITKKDGGAVYNIASSAALCPLPGATFYEASKAAVKNFTESLAGEYSKKKLHVGVICPGFTLTDLFRAQDKTGMKDDRILKLATPCAKMARNIEKTIVKRKRRKVFGFDAKGMALLYTLFPSHASHIIAKILTLSKSIMFDGVFDE